MLYGEGDYRWAYSRSLVHEICNQYAQFLSFGLFSMAVLIILGCDNNISGIITARETFAFMRERFERT